MCGIAGLVAWDERYRIERQTLARMGEAIVHRGPDGRDLWLSEDNGPQCGLAFARLAILDLDPRAMQPMTDGKRWLVFNGEIYNFRELRKELETIDGSYSWKTSGDSEVILRAYEAWGEESVQKFNGMYAFAIWDPTRRELFLCGDRMRQKPLYYAISADRGVIAFASELGALRVLKWPDWTVDPNAVGEYLQTGYIAAEKTIYRGVQKFGQAQWLRVGASSVEFGTYFDPNERSTETVSSVEIREGVLAAVRRQMVSDVPVGCFLSGGIDSSVIALAMKKAAGEQPILTFSIGFDESEYDETQYAAAVAKHLGTQHRQFTVRADAAGDLPKLAKVFGEPFGDSSALPTHYLARETRRYVKVALSGDGGDELFGGYDRYRAMKLAERLRPVAGILQRSSGVFPESNPKSRLTRFGRLARTLHLPPAQRYASYMALFDRDLRRRLYPRDAEGDVVEQAYTRECPGRDVVQAALATDRITYLPEDLLTKVDRASMLHALEVRSPFMDHELVRMTAGLSMDQLLKGGGKRMLREAFAAGLPDFVFRRKKMGFAVPIGHWLRGSLRPMMEDLLGSANSFAAANFERNVLREMIDEHVAGSSDHSQRLYALLMLELWWKQQ